jgi:hypothetical protein
MPRRYKNCPASLNHFHSSSVLSLPNLKCTKHTSSRLRNLKLSGRDSTKLWRCSNFKRCSTSHLTISQPRMRELAQHLRDHNRIPLILWVKEIKSNCDVGLIMNWFWQLFLLLALWELMQCDGMKFMLESRVRGKGGVVCKQIFEVRFEAEVVVCSRLFIFGEWG